MEIERASGIVATETAILFEVDFIFRIRSIHTQFKRLGWPEPADTGVKLFAQKRIKIPIDLARTRAVLIHRAVALASRPPRVPQT